MPGAAAPSGSAAGRHRGDKAVDLANANVSLVNPRLGDANIRVTLAPVANSTSRLSLQWSDTTLPFPGIVRTWTYQVTVHIPGYGDTNSTVFGCEVGNTCAPPDITMQATPSFNGQVVISPPRAPGTRSTSIRPWSTSRWWVTRRASGSWSARTERSPGPPLASHLALVVPGPPYRLKFARVGFADNEVSFTCTAGQNSCGPGTVTLAPTVAVGWMSCTQSWCTLSAAAGAAKANSAAAKPVATTLANPNFFISIPSS